MADVEDTSEERIEEEHGAEGGSAGAAVAASLYPQAPPYFARYTRDNVARLRTLSKAKESDEASEVASRSDEGPSGSDRTTSSLRTSAPGKRRRSSTLVADPVFSWSHASPNERLQRQEQVLRGEEEKRALVEHDRALASSDAAKDGDDAGARRRVRPSLLPAPSWDILLEMEPPNVDWIEQDGFYSCFGEQWPVHETLPSLQDMGMTQIYPSQQDGHRSLDRPAVLTTLLRTMLKSYLSLVDVLLQPPHDYLAADGQTWRFASQDRAREINDLAINVTHLLNEARPLQARHDLRDMMQAQLARRREETVLVRKQCAAMRLEVEALRQQMQSGTGRETPGQA